MLLPGEKFKHIVYKYWANRFDCQLAEFDRKCTKFIKEDDLAEKGKAYVYHIKNMRVVRMAPDLVDVIDNPVVSCLGKYAIGLFFRPD